MRARVETHSAEDGGTAEERDRHRVHRREQSAEPDVDDPGGEEQLERVGRNPEHIEQERHGGVEAAEEGQQSGEREPGIFESGTGASANHPANIMKLSDSSFPVWGKLNDAGTITSGSPADCHR